MNERNRLPGQRAGLTVLLGLIALALFVVGLSSTNSRANAQQTASDRVEIDFTDQIIVKFVESVQPASMTTADQAELLQRMSAVAGVDMTFLRPMSDDAYVFALPQQTTVAQVDQIGNRLAGMPAVRYAEPDYIFTVFETGNTASLEESSDDVTPDDPRYSDQWHYRYEPGEAEGINLPPAWGITTGTNQIIVAVVDTGILDHADLAGKTVPGYDFISSPDVANDGDGRDPDPADPGDWTEKNFCYPFSPSTPSSWHGTHVAGTIGAATDNGVGVAGISWGAKILPVRALGRCGGYLSDILDGARWAAGLEVTGAPTNTTPADVINLSLGRSGSCSILGQIAIDDIVAAGTTMVVAAGNDTADASDYSPASCDNVITVAATDRQGDLAWYSNYGDTVEISAPGGENLPLGNGVLSTLNSGSTSPEEDSYAYYQGTSMASPHIAGIVALLIRENPGLTPAQVLERLQSTARQFPNNSDL